MQQVENKYLEELYQTADYFLNKNEEAYLYEAKRLFAELSHLSYKDSKEKEEIASKEAKRQAEVASKEAERIVKSYNKIAIIATSIICVIIAFFTVLTMVIFPNNKYNDAIALMEAGNLEEAYEAFIALDGYKDSTEKAKSIFYKYKEEKIKVAHAGDYVIFGTYEQDNDKSNGKEVIEWLVLEVKNGKALLISKYILDRQPYNTSKTEVTWETCTLREWLNKEFLNSAFSVDEKTMISTATVSADKLPGDSTKQGNDTQDQVFLLSIIEIDKYFNSKSARQCKPTDFQRMPGFEEDGDNIDWWSRTIGSMWYFAAIVDENGGWSNAGIDEGDWFGVRPALWIDLNS